MQSIYYDMYLIYVAKAGNILKFFTCCYEGLSGQTLYKNLMKYCQNDQQLSIEIYSWLKCSAAGK